MTSKTVGKPPKNHRAWGSGPPVLVSPGTTHKHHAHGKHQNPRKHQHTAKHHPRAHHKKRGWSPGYDIECCAAQALGTLLGWDEDQVLGLYWRTARDPDAGASILATLEAWRERDLNPRHPGYEPGALTELRHPAPLILGVELPGPHAIAVTPDGTWWSWSEPFSPLEWPELVVEEAWALWL